MVELSILVCFGNTRHKKVFVDIRYLLQKGMVLDMINLHQLKLFKTVVEFDGFTKASEFLYISQPAISMQIKKLEADIGLQLLERCGHQIQLTQAGQELFKYATEILLLMEETEEKMQNLRGMNGAKIRLGVSTTPGVYLLPSLITYFRKQYPKIEVDIIIQNSRSIEEKLLNNTIDLAILGEKINYDPSIQTEFLTTDELVFISGKNHELANKQINRLSDLSQQNFVLREKGSSTREIAEKGIADARIVMKNIWEVPSIEGIKQVVIANGGISILSLLSIKLEVLSGHIVVLPVEKPLSLSRNINLAHHRLKEFSPAVCLFYQFIKDEFTKI
jgi:DNA-binding transcriptional LysR family regulator